ncbi:MAG: CsbD family protein [Ignavibacteriales bacterium]|nr:CsbD family protein [Ignavibacteriales bacterium]
MIKKELEIHWDAGRTRIRDFFNSVKNEDLPLKDLDEKSEERIVDKIAERLETTKDEAQEILAFAVNGNLDLKSKWKYVSGKLKQSYAELTDDDLLWAEGKKDELMARLQEKLNVNRDQLEKKLWSIIKSEK